MATYIIDGRLTRDAEMKSTKEGKQFAKFSVAWNRGEKKPTHFYSCTLGGEKATKLLTYLTKGKYVIITGEPDWYEYEGKTLETIRVDKLTFAGGSSEPSVNTSQNNPEGKPYTRDGKFFDTKEELDAYIKSTQSSSGPEDFDDSDIPF